MAGTIFALLLFGCADDGTACERLAGQQPKHYDSQVLCESDADAALQSEIALRSDYPEVVAKCIPVNLLARLGHESLDLAADRSESSSSFAR